MRRFRFNLQRVLDWRQTVEDVLLAELAVVQAEHDREQARLADATHARDVFRVRMRDELSKGEAEDIRQAYHYLRQLAREVISQQARVRLAVEKKDRKTAEVVEAARDRKVLERLKQQASGRHQQEAEREQQKFLDDVAGIGHQRRAVGSKSGSDLRPRTSDI